MLRPDISHLHSHVASFLVVYLLSVYMLTLYFRQKNIYEWQVASYEKLANDLENALNEPVATIDHLKTKHLYTLIENSVCSTVVVLVGV